MEQRMICSIRRSLDFNREKLKYRAVTDNKLVLQNLFHQETGQMSVYCKDRKFRCSTLLSTFLELLLFMHIHSI